jgi:uncharacterized protein YndB with AHSA1/START domain
MPKKVQWRIHCKSGPERLFELLSTDAGRRLFWAEESRSSGSGFSLRFPDGTEERCLLVSAEPPHRFAFRYFGSEVEILLQPDGSGGTDLTLTNIGVPQEDYDEVNAGWLSVLLPLKAAADFGVDLRNHDPRRTWRELYVDQ